MSTNQIPSLVNGSVQPSYTNYMPQQNDFSYYTSSQAVNTSYFGTSSNFSVFVQDYKTSTYRTCETYTGVPYYHGYVNRPISTDVSKENSNYGKESALCSSRKRSRSRSVERKKVDLFDLALSKLSAESKNSDSSMEEGPDKEKEKINLKKQKLNQIRQKWRKRHQARNEEKNSETKKQSVDGNVEISNPGKQSDSEKDEKNNSSEKVKKSDTYQRKSERSQDQSRPSTRNGNQITESRYKDSSPPLPLRRFPIHNRYSRYGGVDGNTLRRFKYDVRDSSPPRRSHDFRDSSPPRRFRHESPRRYRYNGPDLSPSYHTRYDSTDSSPSRRLNHDSSSSPVRRPRHDTSSSPVRRPRHDTSSSPTRSLRQDTTDSNTTQCLDDDSNAASPSKRTRHDTPTPTRDELPSDQSKSSSSSDVDGKEQDKNGALYSQRHPSWRQVSNKYRLSRRRRNSHSHRSRSRSQDRHHSKYGNNESTVEDGELKSSEESSFSDTNCVNSAKGSRKYGDRPRDKSLTPEKGHHSMNQIQLIDNSVSPASLVMVSDSDTSLISSPKTTGSPVKIQSSSPVKISSKTVKELFQNKQCLPNPNDENLENLNKSTNVENPPINEAVFTPKSDSRESQQILELEKQNLEFKKKINELKMELEAKNKALETFEIDADAKMENLNETFSEEVEVLKEEITFLKRDNDREREFAAKSKAKEKDLLNRIGRLEDGLLHSGKENLELREKLKKLEEEMDSLRYKKYQVNYSSTSTSRNYYDFPSN